MLTLELAQDLMPAVSRLVDSEYEDYMLCGLNTFSVVHKVIAPLIRDAREAAKSDMFRGEVDISFEERLEKCVTLRDAFAAIRPRLQDLASARGGKGRSAALAARLLKALQRTVDT